MRKFSLLIAALVVLASFIGSPSEPVKQEPVVKQAVMAPEVSLVPDYSYPPGHYSWYKLGNTCQCWYWYWMGSGTTAIEIGWWNCLDQPPAIVHGIPCSGDALTDVIAKTNQIISLDY